MKKSYYLTVCLNPTIQKTLVLKETTYNEVNRVSESYLDASGKGINVTRILKQMGGKVRHLTHNSNSDSEGFLRMCNRDKLKVDVVKAPIQVRTCTTILTTNTKSVTEFVEKGELIPKETETKILNKFDKLLKGAHTLILSGSTAPGYSVGIYADMVRAAKMGNIVVILDIRGEFMLQTLEHKPDYIKINMSEFVQTFFPDKTLKESDNPSKFLPEIEKKANEIKEKQGTKFILTMGSRGVISYAGEKPIQTSAIKFNIKNTIGCGDAFTAGFALQLHKDPSDLQNAINIGQKCAAANAVLIRPGRIIG